MEVKGILINKRASKRYTYLPQARIEAPNLSQSVQVRDVSHSGIQFFSNLLIRNKTPLIATWKDATVGNLVPFVMVVRKIDQEPGMTFRYCYGSQFVNLRHETKLNIQKLLIQNKKEEEEANKNLIQKITVISLISIIKQGRSFLQNLLTATDTSKLFYRFTRDIKEYEIKSFDATDEVSLQIQKLTALNFNCNLLNVAIPMIPKNNAQGFEFYKEAVNKIEQINGGIVEARKYMDSPLATESVNRLFYNKLELLQTFVEAYESDSETGKSEPVKKIVEEYKRTSPKPRR